MQTCRKSLQKASPVLPIWGIEAGDEKGSKKDLKQHWSSLHLSRALQVRKRKTAAACPSCSFEKGSKEGQPTFTLANCWMTSAQWERNHRQVKTLLYIKALQFVGDCGDDYPPHLKGSVANAARCCCCCGLRGIFSAWTTEPLPLTPPSPPSLFLTSTFSAIYLLVNFNITHWVFLATQPYCRAKNPSPYIPCKHLLKAPRAHTHPGDFMSIGSLQKAASCFKVPSVPLTPIFPFWLTYLIPLYYFLACFFHVNLL